MAKFTDLLGKTIKNITGLYLESEEIIIECSDGKNYILYNDDQSSIVEINDIIGDINDLIDSPILISEERHGHLLPRLRNSDEGYTWTFYELATIKGSVTIRWYGSSNGYYSEDVYFEEITLNP
jgi:hypothetical protein